MRTRCHGLSGAKYTSGIRKSGHTHWMANGMRYAHSLVLVARPFSTPVATSCPKMNDMFVNEVRYDLNDVGRTSDAYEGADVARMAHGKLHVSG